MPEAPETLEGWYVLHDFRRLDWPRWKALPESTRAEIVEEAVAFLQECAATSDAEEGSSGIYSVLGHKADLLLLHLRPTLEHLNHLENAFARTRLADYTTGAYSYVSVTELGLYEIQSRGVRDNPMDAPFVRARLKFRLPEKRYIVFYPMNKRRGEEKNWYMLPMEERRRQMKSHGTIGHKYFGVVQQMIGGSVGLDDWEWGVTLFSDESLQFKKLVYEMRFDEVSAVYAEFGPFLVGYRLTPETLHTVL